MKYLQLAKKLAVIIAAFAIAFYFIIIIKSWADRQGNYFFFKGDMESWATLLVLGFVFVKAIEWLLRLEIHAVFNMRERPPKRQAGK